MAKQQKRFKSRKGSGRKSGGKRTWGQSGPMCVLPAPSNKVYRFERWISPVFLVPTAADKGWVFSYNLANFAGASEFTSLFDLYRMTSLEITFSLTVAGPIGVSPVLNFLADYDTFLVPTTIDTVSQRPHKRVQLTNTAPSYTFKLRPRVLAVIQTTSGTAASALAPANQWMDCNDSTVSYGGLLGWIENFISTSGTQVAVSVRGLFDFAMVR